MFKADATDSGNYYSNEFADQINYTDKNGNNYYLQHPFFRV